MSGQGNSNFSTYGFATKALHVGQDPSQWTSRAVVPPIVMTSTYAQVEPGVTGFYQYGRSQNPTRESLQNCLASLEKADYALVYASGLATIANVIQLLAAGDHIVAGYDLYGGTTRYFNSCTTKFGISIDYVDCCTIEKVTAAVKPNTGLVWFETPSNPLLRVVDIEAVCREVKKINPKVIITVDNTFLSPYFQSPLTLGADIVMNSLTKYINGHSDVVMGSLATNRADLYESLKFAQKAVGAVPSPFDCFLVNRGIKTLALRMEQHQKNALEVAKFLETHALIRKVIYLGLESHPQYHLVMKQCTGTGGMVSVYIRGTLETTKAFLSQLKVFTLAESLGGVESLVAIPMLCHESWVTDTRSTRSTGY